MEMNLKRFLKYNREGKMKEEGIRIYNVEDLVLKVSKYYDQEKYELEKWEPFVDALCRDREYQKEAIFTAIKYMLNNKYNSKRFSNRKL